MKAEELKYTKNHMWVYAEGDTVTMGLTDFAQNELGDIVFVEMPEKGKKIEKEDVLGTVESVKSVSDLVSPVAGEVLDINTLLEDSPETINSDPLGKGWILKVKIENAADLESLLDQAAYQEFADSQ